LCGKKELESYILKSEKSRMYWIRQTKDILVNKNRGLAWETGSYSAMWIRELGSWKIKSQLFVTSDEQ